MQDAMDSYGNRRIQGFLGMTDGEPMCNHEPGEETQIHSAYLEGYDSKKINPILLPKTSILVAFKGRPIASWDQRVSSTGL